ncbi:hypothetical protein [Streptomyces sp. NPDC054771]
MYLSVEKTELLRRLNERNQRADAYALTVTPAALKDVFDRFEVPASFSAQARSFSDGVKNTCSSRAVISRLNRGYAVRSIEVIPTPPDAQPGRARRMHPRGIIAASAPVEDRNGGTRDRAKPSVVSPERGSRLQDHPTAPFGLTLKPPRIASDANWTHLAPHCPGRTLADCTQADVDVWYAGGYTARRLTHAFLRWAMRSKHMTKVTVPHRSTSNPAPLAQHQRLTLLRQTVNRDDIPLQDRVAAALVLLHAQPLTRIARLTIDDVLWEHGEVLVRLGDPPSPVPEPFAGMLLAHLDQRPNTMTATNPDAPWLFPGRRAGQPMTPDTLELRLRYLGFPTQRGRTAAIRHLVLQAPAPVVARMLGYHDDTTAQLAAEAGGTWRRYAPGDHRR